MMQFQTSFKRNTFYLISHYIGIISISIKYTNSFTTLFFVICFFLFYENETFNRNDLSYKLCLHCSNCFQCHVFTCNIYIMKRTRFNFQHLMQIKGLVVVFPPVCWITFSTHALKSYYEFHRSEHVNYRLYNCTF